MEHYEYSIWKLFLQNFQFFFPFRINRFQLVRCSVCEGNITGGRFIGRCLHYFHKRCLFGRGSRCSQCREEMGSSIVEGECAICLESLQKLTFITNCRHTFHNGCISKWILANENCPFCSSHVKLQEIYRGLNIYLGSIGDPFGIIIFVSYHRSSIG